MTKRAFLVLLERQRKSGLSMKEFSLNEAFAPSNFYYWKSKYCPSSSQVYTDIGEKDISEDFAPVRFPVAKCLTSSASEDLPKWINGIMIELPSGIKIHFRGVDESKAALGIISQICSSHVLPQ
jgi:hypothetical protein